MTRNENVILTSLASNQIDPFNSVTTSLPTIN